MVSLIVSLFFAVGVGLVARSWARRRVDGGWMADDVSDSKPCRVQLIAGPWPEKTVTITGMPCPGTRLSTRTRGLVGGGVRDGYYQVIELDHDNRKAIASWVLAPR